MRSNKYIAAMLALLATPPASACDALYVSPIAISKHWGGSGWNEVHPGLAGECRIGRGYFMAGRMRNSLDRIAEFVSAGATLPLNGWFAVRVGATVGRYDNVDNMYDFAAPVVALTVGDGRAVAFDVTHIPANGFSPVPVTLLSARWKAW